MSGLSDRFRSVARRWRPRLERLLPSPFDALRGTGRELRIDLEFVVGHLRQRRTDVRFVQVGAFDGLGNDVMAGYVRRFGWRGVLVEPQPSYFDRLKANYADQPQVRFENAAVDVRPGSRPFYAIRPDADFAKLPDWAPQIASFDLETVLRAQSIIPNLPDLIVAYDVPCVTLAEVVERHALGGVDFLQIDAEGYDFEIIRGIDFDRLAPSLIRFEHKNLTRRDVGRCLDLLTGRGYRVAADGEDAIAYRPPAPAA